MIRRLKMTIAVVAGLALVMPTAAVADTNGAIAATGGMTASLPVFGMPLDVEVELDDRGNITAVTVGSEPVEDAGAHKVRFDIEDDITGEARVDVKVKNHRITSSVKAATLADLIGPGTWSADVFGDGQIATVAYSIGDGPTVTIDAITIDSSGADAGFNEIRFEDKPGSEDDDEDDDEAVALVLFRSDGYEKRLKISVEVEDDDEDDGDDDETEFLAKLAITLSGKDRRKLRGSLEDIVGPHSWTGATCDGTAVTVDYVVTETGDVADVVVTGWDDHEVEERDHGFEVEFDDSKLRLRVAVKQTDDGEWKLDAKARADRCKHDRDDEHRGKKDKDDDHDDDDDDDDDDSDDDD